MSALADRSDDDKDDNSKDNIPLFPTEDIKALPIEKQFTHMLFCQQIENIDLDNSKKLLAQLHLLYLGQTTLFSKLAKEEFRGSL